MNWVLIAVIVILAASFIIGWIRGFAKMLISLIAVAASVLLTIWLTPKITGWLEEKTEWDQNLAVKVEENILKDWGDDADVRERLENPLLPSILRDKGNEIIAAHPETSARSAIASYVAHVILSGIVAILLFIIAMILLRLLGRLLNLTKKVPGLRQINGFLGGLLGLAEGIIFVDLFFLLITVISGIGVGTAILELIGNNGFLQWLYENNFLLKAFALVKGKLIL